MKTYGHLSYFNHRKQWGISGEPDIFMWLKRIFRKVYEGSFDIVYFDDTDAIRRDLLWFMDRFPLAISPQDRNRLSLGAERHREKIRTLEDLIGNGYRPTAFSKLSIPARDYQGRTAEVYLRQGSLLCGDDVGLGKTVTAICSFLDPRTLPAVVVTLSGAMPFQWEEEINRFAPKLKTHVIKKARPYVLPGVSVLTEATPRTMRQRAGKPPDVLILNYHKLAGWAQVLAKYCKSVVWDEVQELRRPGSLKYDAALHLARSVDFRLGLSQTPIFNYGVEFFFVYQCIQAGALGSLSEFLREWCTDTGGSYMPTTGKARLKDAKAFGSYLRREFLMVRNTRKEVGRELPPVTIIPHQVESTGRSLSGIRSSAMSLAQMIVGELNVKFLERGKAAREFDMRIRQATGIDKAPFVADFVRMLVESGEPVVLYGWHRAVYEIWKERLEDLEPAWITGSESPSAKVASKWSFINGATKLIIISLRAGQGLDGLQKVSRIVVFGELDWSAGVHVQALGRVARDGQEDPVSAYYLLSDEGSDPIVVDVLGIKREQLEGVINPKEPILEKIETDPHHIQKMAKAFLDKERRSR